MLHPKVFSAHWEGNRFHSESEAAKKYFCKTNHSTLWFRFRQFQGKRGAVKIFVLTVAPNHILHSSAEYQEFAKKGELVMHRICSSALPEQWPL